ncbi:MAG: lipocalin family protein [Alistipes sp.]|nr:lipocalin family protein [Alistipes sp.]
MKNWFYLTWMLMAVALCGCSKETEKIEPQLEVTPHNISGTWQLESWHNGVQLAEGAYLYMELIRKDACFKSYDNIESAAPRYRTGQFNIEVDPELGAIIRGMYDYSGGDWNHRYIVTSLTASEMIWVAKDDSTEVSVFVRAEIPSEVLEAVK